MVSFHPREKVGRKTPAAPLFRADIRVTLKDSQAPLMSGDGPWG